MKIVAIIVMQILATKALEPRSVNLDIETVLQFDNNDKSGDLKFIEDVQSFLGKMKDVIDHNKVSRRSHTQPKAMKFTDFLKQFLYALKTYKNEDLEDALAILDNEIRKYHYKGCKFYELIQENSLRRFIGNKLSVIQAMDGNSIKKGINKILRHLEKAKFDYRQNELLDYINSLYRYDSTQKLESVLQEIKSYGNDSRRSDLNLVKIIKNALRSVIFDHYSNLNTNARHDLKLKIEAFWKHANKNYNNLTQIKTTKSKNIFQDITFKILADKQFDKPIVNLLSTNQPVYNIPTIKSMKHNKHIVKKVPESESSDLIEQINSGEKHKDKKIYEHLYSVEKKHKKKKDKKGKKIKIYKEGKRADTVELKESEEKNEKESEEKIVEDIVETTTKARKHEKTKKSKRKHKKVTTKHDYSEENSQFDDLTTKKVKKTTTEKPIYAIKTKSELDHVYELIDNGHILNTRKAVKITHKPTERKRKHSFTIADDTVEETTKKAKRKKKEKMRSNTPKLEETDENQSDMSYKASVETEDLTEETTTTEKPKKHKLKRKSNIKTYKHSEEVMPRHSGGENRHPNRNTKYDYIYRRKNNHRKDLEHSNMKKYAEKELSTKKTKITTKDLTTVKLTTAVSIPTTKLDKRTEKHIEKTNLETKDVENADEKYEDVKKHVTKDAHSEQSYYDDEVAPTAPKNKTKKSLEIKTTEKTLKKDVVNSKLKDSKKVVSEHDYYYDDVTAPMAPEIKTTILTTKTVTETTPKITTDATKTKTQKTDTETTAIFKENQSEILSNRRSIENRHENNELNDNYNDIQNYEDQEEHKLIKKQKSVEKSTLKLNNDPFSNFKTLNAATIANQEEQNLTKAPKQNQPKVLTPNDSKLSELPKQVDPKLNESLKLDEPKLNESPKLDEPKINETTKLVEPKRTEPSLPKEPTSRAEPTLPTDLKSWNQPILQNEPNIPKVQIPNEPIFRAESTLRDYTNLLNLPTLPNDPNLWNKPILQGNSLGSETDSPKLPNLPQLPQDPLQSDPLFKGANYPSENLLNDPFLKDPIPNLHGESNLPSVPNQPGAFNFPNGPSESLRNDPVFRGEPLSNLPSESLPNQPLLPPDFNFNNPELRQNLFNSMPSEMGGIESLQERMVNDMKLQYGSGKVPIHDNQ